MTTALSCPETEFHSRVIIKKVTINICGSRLCTHSFPGRLEKYLEVQLPGPVGRLWSNRTSEMAARGNHHEQGMSVPVASPCHQCLSLLGVQISAFMGVHLTDGLMCGSLTTRGSLFPLHPGHPCFPSEDVQIFCQFLNQFFKKNFLLIKF